MRAVAAIFLACVLALGYEIRHENEGKIYKFAGEADGSKFELYISELEAEFENFSDKGAVLPPKFQGHAFFEGARYDFSKGSIEKSGADITAVSAVAEWLNLSVKADNGELAGKLAIRGKARKAMMKQLASYDFTALGLQKIGRDAARFEAVASDFYSPKFAQNNKKSLSAKLENFKSAWLKDPSNNAASALNNLEYQNSKIRSVCELGAGGKICKTVWLKNLKKINLSDIFKDLNDANLTALFAKEKITPSENFTLSPSGITFFDGTARSKNSEVSLPLEPIKEHLKQNFGLF
ncbi:hypothetical protein [Campylobacter showae]|uniref:hypothetical protein n=1 Tax=Campylobacter showae TaxID=204 RepID=UPI0028D239B4|nr:hypothetical protein [Campylobacter showae]